MKLEVSNVYRTIQYGLYFKEVSQEEKFAILNSLSDLDSEGHVWELHVDVNKDITIYYHYKLPAAPEAVRIMVLGFVNKHLKEIKL